MRKLGGAGDSGPDARRLRTKLLDCDSGLWIVKLTCRGATHVTAEKFEVDASDYALERKVSSEGRHTHEMNNACNVRSVTESLLPCRMDS